MIEFTVPGDARGWARARVNSRGGKPIHFMDRQTRSYENLVKIAAAEAMRGRPLLDAPCALTLTIRKTPPISVSKVKRAAMLANTLRPGVKPDCSNVAKGVEDALNGIVYRDDALICDLIVRKIYSEIPGVDVRVEALCEPVE